MKMIPVGNCDYCHEKLDYYAYQEGHALCYACYVGIGVCNGDYKQEYEWTCPVCGWYNEHYLQDARFPQGTSCEHCDRIVLEVEAKV